VRGIVASLPLASPERVHFRSFEESGLRFEVVFHVESPEYGVYMDHLHEFNLRLKEALESRGIGFAFPTRVMKTIPAE
jgi:small-conductance mechanosensitive channel